MFSKFSVKKPLTIFVAVFMVIILGFVSFSRMTPDLLPGINLPYAMVVTVYPGATPEEVEEQISKPLESAMASIENIDAITSTSSDSVSQIMLQFNDNASMDMITPEIREKINAVSGSWNEMVATPYIIKINPDLLPVGVFAVDYNGKDNIDLTQFINDDILSELEGVSGIASVDLNGNVSEQVSVILSQEKIDAINEKIKKALDKQFDEADDEINDKEQDLADGKEELDDQKITLNSTKEELEKAQEALVKETAKAQAELVDKKIQIENTIGELKTQIASAEQSLPMLETTVGILVDVKEKYDEALVKQEELQAKIDELDKVENPTDEQKAEKISLQIQIGVIESTFKVLEQTIAQFDITLDDLSSEVTKMQEQITALKEGIDKMEITVIELQSASVQVTNAMQELNKQQIGGALDLSSGLSQVIAGQGAVESALAQMDSAQAQIDTAKDQIQEQKDLAYEKATLDITMDMVNQILVAQNFSMPAGYITEDGVDYLIRIGDKAVGVEEFANMPIMDTGMEDVGIIRLSDVASVFLENNSQDIYAKVNGEDAVIMSFSKQSSFATKTVSDNLNIKFDKLEKEYDGLTFSKLSDQGDYISIIIGTVLDALIYGAILAVLILIFFLKDIRPTIIIACSIPVSLMFAIVLMYFSGITLNIISLSGLAIGVGMLVDNSVVVIENIYRMRAEGETSLKAAVKGATQVTGAIIASTLTTVCVFLPIVFVEGITRQLFTDMALTIAYSLMASLIVAITLVPAMASSLLKKEKQTKSFIITKLTNGYEFLATKSLKHKWVVLVVSVVLLVTSIMATLARGFIFMPTMSGTQITVNVTPPEDATFEEKKEIADKVAQIVGEIDEIETVGSMIKTETTGGMQTLSAMVGGADITMYAIMKDDAKRKDSEVSKEIVESCKDIDAIVTAKGSMDMGSMLTAMTGAGVSVKIYGDNLDNLITEADLLADKIGSVDGIESVKTSVDDSNPEVRIVVDKDKAMENGLMVAQVFQAISSNVKTQLESTTLTVDADTKDIIIYDGNNMETTIDDIKNMSIKYTTFTGENKEIDLNKIADIVETKSLNSVKREDQKRVVTVSATIDSTKNITLVTDKVMGVLDDYKTIDGNTIHVGGESEAIIDAFVQLVYMALLAIVIIYFIMVAQFQSFKSPFIVMFTIPLAFTGGFLGILITGFELSVIAMVGFIMLAGIIVNNGIVLIDYINILRLEGMEKREAIIKAGVTRLRPILMTSLTTVLGLVFVAVGTGVGSEMMQPMAIVCIGGLLYATLMTLFVVPAMYDVLSRKKMEKRIVD